MVRTGQVIDNLKAPVPRKQEEQMEDCNEDSKPFGPQLLLTRWVVSHLVVPLSPLESAHF